LYMVLVTMHWVHSYTNPRYERLIFGKMKKRLNLKTWSAMMLALTVLLGTSCDSEPKGDRPELPPADVLFMDYSDFAEQPGMAKSTAATYENFLHAYGTILFWHSPAITAYTALPVAAYAVALAQEAEYMGDNTWEWSYDIDWFGTEYIVTLTASRINNEEFSILMDVALASLPNLGVKWFDGIVSYDHSMAAWSIYKEGTVSVLEAKMSKDYEAETASLKYTYAEPGMEETGSFILYAYDSGKDYDASYSVSLSAGLTQIEWNTATKAGHVRDQVKFGDEQWHCWDSLENGLVDTICE